MSDGFPLSVSVRTDTGRVRTNNEDSYGMEWLDDGSLFVIVADGMGGHEAGEVASQMAVDIVARTLTGEQTDDPRARIYDGLLAANAAIIDEGQRTGRRGMGTTSVVSVIRGGRAFVGLVGDSRLFHVRDGKLLWRTLDHTRIQSLLDRGLINEEEARGHADAGMLTRALGHARMSNGEPLEPEVLAEPLRLETGDAVVLCTDGCHDLVEPWEIAQLVAGATAQEGAERLVHTALQRGGHDNVTVAVVVCGDRTRGSTPSIVPAEDLSFSPDNATTEAALLEVPHPERDTAPPPRPAGGSPGGRITPSAAPEEATPWYWLAAVAGIALLGLAMLMLGTALWLAAL